MKKLTVTPDEIVYEFQNESDYQPQEVIMLGYTRAKLKGLTDNIPDKPFQLYGICIIAKFRPQFENPLFICEGEFAGPQKKMLFYPFNYMSAAQTKTNTIYVPIREMYQKWTMPTNELIINVNTYIRTIISPSTKAEYRFVINEELHEKMKSKYRMRIL